MEGAASKSVKYEGDPQPQASSPPDAYHSAQKFQLQAKT